MIDLTQTPVGQTKQILHWLSSNLKATYSDLEGKIIELRNWLQNANLKKEYKTVESPQLYILQRLHLEHTTIKQEIVDGEITLVQAWIIARLPAAEQRDWLPKTKTMEIDALFRAIMTRKQEIRFKGRKAK